MNDDMIYKSNVISLFLDNFNEIKKKYKDDDYNWKNFENIFLYLYKKLNQINLSVNELIKYYYLFTFIYLGYTNYLAFINHKDLYNDGLEKIVNKIKTSPNIIKKLLEFSHNSNIYKIIKLNDIFICNKIKKKNLEQVLIEKYTQEYIFDLKQFDKISSLPNDNYKKILNLLIYRYAICKKNNYLNYHELYLKKIVGKKNIYNSSTLIDFDIFIHQIPNSKKILNINVNTEFKKNLKKKNVLEINLIKIINFILEKNNDVQEFYIEQDNKNFIIIKSKNYEGNIKINISSKYENLEFNQYQINYNFLHYNIDEINEFNFLKKTFTNIEINIFDEILKDYSTILEFIHLILISTKILSTNPSDIYECLYPVDYSNYYLETFSYFLDFFKNEINNNMGLNKFIIDVIKFLYIYSYYDYYFYYSNDLVETLINNLQYKNEIFLEFTQNLKKVLKLPQELNNFPPFFNQEYDINAIIYYNFEIPSYFKLYDFLNAINIFFNSDNKNINKEINIFDLIVSNIFFDEHFIQINSASKSINLGISNVCINKNYKSSNSISESSESSESKTSSDSQIISEVYKKKHNIKSNKYLKKELESNLDTEILNVLDECDKTKMISSNAYVELNYLKKNENYLLDTEC